MRSPTRSGPCSGSRLPSASSPSAAARPTRDPKTIVAQNRALVRAWEEQPNPEEPQTAFGGSRPRNKPAGGLTDGGPGGPPRDFPLTPLEPSGYRDGGFSRG